MIFEISVEKNQLSNLKQFFEILFFCSLCVMYFVRALEIDYRLTWNEVLKWSFTASKEKDECYFSKL